MRGGDEEGKGLKLVALHEFLVQQDDRLINELYTHPATCMSVFRQVLSCFDDMGLMFYVGNYLRSPNML